MHTSSTYLVSQLFIYPIKSLGGIELKQSNITSRGLEYDRRYMLIDEQHRFLSQRELPELARMNTYIHSQRIHIIHQDAPEAGISVPLSLVSGEEVRVGIWEDQCTALLADQETNDWFSSLLQKSVRLVYMPEYSQRSVDEDYAIHSDLNSFSDGFPILLIGQASLDELNKRLSISVGMDRFRPNIVFVGGVPHQEDSFRHFTCNGVDFFAIKPCARCSVTTTDQQTGEIGKEPLRTLAGYRMGKNKIYFGQNVLVGKTGLIQVGDQISIKDYKLPVTLS